MRSQAWTQTTARMNYSGTTEGHEADGSGTLGADGENMGKLTWMVLEAKVRAAVMSVRVGTGGTEDGSGGGARGKAEPDRTEGVKRRSTAEASKETSWDQLEHRRL